MELPLQLDSRTITHSPRYLRCANVAHLQGATFLRCPSFLMNSNRDHFFVISTLLQLLCLQLYRYMGSTQQKKFAQKRTSCTSLSIVRGRDNRKTKCLYSWSTNHSHLCNTLYSATATDHFVRQHSNRVTYELTKVQNAIASGGSAPPLVLTSFYIFESVDTHQPKCNAQGFCDSFLKASNTFTANNLKSVC